MKLFTVILFTVLAVIAGVSAEDTIDQAPTCPEECVCPSSDAHKLDCSGKKHAHLPNLSSDQFTILDLSNNEIKDLDENLVQNYKQVTDLNLSGNMIRDIPDWFSEKLPQLKHLHLSSNKITNVNQEFKNLEVLCLKNNSLNAKSLTTLKAPQLKNLNLNSCNLTDLSADFFSGMPNLEILDLSGNPLPEKLNLSPFTGSKLQTVVLPKNIDPNQIDKLTARNIRVCLDKCEPGNHDHNKESEVIAGAVLGPEHNMPQEDGLYEDYDEVPMETTTVEADITEDGSSADNSTQEISTEESTTVANISEETNTTELAPSLLRNAGGVTAAISNTTDADDINRGAEENDNYDEDDTTDLELPVTPKVFVPVDESAVLRQMPPQDESAVTDQDAPFVLSEDVEADVKKEDMAMKVDGAEGEDEKTMAASAPGSNNVIDSALIGIILSVLVLIAVFFIVKKNWPKIRRSMRSGGGRQEQQQPLPEEMPLNKV